MSVICRLGEVLTHNYNKVIDRLLSIRCALWQLQSFRARGQVEYCIKCGIVTGRSRGSAGPDHSKHCLV